MKTIKKIKIYDEIIYFNTNNSIFSSSPSDNNLYCKIDVSNYLYEFKPTSFNLCINISNNCNLMCDYCFNKEKHSDYFDIDKIKETIMFFIDKYNNCEKYFVDLSGKGEPLLFLQRIFEINDFCKQLSNKINKEILVSFVTNGVLLTRNIVNKLQENSILFGVSIDGNRYIHDKHRKDLKNNGTYDVIMNNLQRIENKDYIGCAVTLTNDVFSLVDSLKELSHFFKTISYKPARDEKFGINSRSLKKWMKEYDSLTLFLRENFKNNDLKYIKILLNGDDYFGKFMYRCLMNYRTLNRCDAGVSRFAVDGDGKIYNCAPMSISKYNQSNLNSFDNLKKQVDRLMNECRKCSFKYICGGECEVVHKMHNKNDKIMCKFKKHLIINAVYISIISKNILNNITYSELIDFCIEKSNREYQDKELKKFLNKHKQYSFVEGKKVFDSINRRY